MKKMVILFMVMVVFSKYGSAVEYKNAVGLRIGWWIGITGRHFIKNNKALEGIVSFWNGGFDATALYEVYNAKNLNVKNLSWYYGGGIHLGYWNACSGFNAKCNTGTWVGIDGVLGLEYEFVDPPVSVGIDWQPGINFTGYTGFWANNIGLSVRYVF